MTWLVEPDRMDTEAAVQVRILGPIEVIESGDATPLTPQLRRLLGLLVVADGGYVSADRIAEDLADGDVDGSKIRTAVSRLRKVLGDRIETVPGGYRLRLAEDELDAAQFESMRDRARTAVPPGRIRLSVEALGLWRGAALEGVADADWATAAAARLESARAVLTEDLADALSEVGRFEEAIELLDTHLVDHLYRERPVALLMRALAGAGRLPDALRAYQRFRLTLRDDMGLDPSPELRALEAELLAASDRDSDRSAGGRSHDETDSSPGDHDGQSDEGAPVAGLPAAMGRPSGIVTFLFTDIEGSTARWEADPAGMRSGLVAHDEVLRAAVEVNGGWLFKHTGDGICAAFVSPNSAVGAAVEAQRTLELPVRMGIATGEAVLADADYFGPTLNLAARVMSAGHGGQILVAETTVGLVDAPFTDLGTFQLRGLSGRRRIFQATAPGLRTDFPPLITLNPVPGNLPVQTTSFVGRESDLTTVSALLESQRLVTLTGVGGVGKTRLALQVATDLLPQFGDGVWFVELAEVGDPRAVPSAVAAPLGIVPQAERSIKDTVADSLAGRRALLVLDNCEHVLDAAADLVEALLGRSTEVKILATSRESLRVPGEHVWSVPSLDVRAGSDSNAAALFEERAQAVNASFLLADDPAAVIAICEQLDGIALAIELAAARMVSMTPADLRDRLDDRFRILGGGRRGLERHQTLRQAVQWSYELLDADEQQVLDHCSTFAGGFDIGAAEAICATGDLDEFSLFDVLDSLVRKSMLVAERHANHVRYRMLETIRQFAHDRLVAVGSVESAHDRHALHYANGANQVMIRWASPEQPDAYRWFGTELANLRAAFRWSSDHGDIDTAATIAGKTAFIGTYFQSFEPFSWCKELLEHPLVGGHRLQKWLYLGAAQGAFLGNAEEAIRYGEAGLALEPADHEPVTHELEKTAIGVAHLFAGRPDKWLAIAQEVSNSPKDDLALGRVSVVWVLATLGEYERATAIADEMLEGAKATGVPWSIAYALSAYGKAFTNLDPERALTAHREAVAVARESNNRMFEMVFSRELAGLEAIAGDPDAALDTFEEIIQAFHQTGDVGNLSPTLGYLAVFLERIEQLDDAATTFGAASRHASALAMVTELGVVADRLGDQLGSAFEPFVSRGRAMNSGEAVRHAQNAITRARNAIG